MKKLNIYLVLAVFVLLNANIFAQEKDEEEKEAYKFKLVHNVNCTPVKSQDMTGTCWSFSTSSFLESELMRLGFGEHDISEMFIVRNTFPKKADKYIRLHGNYNFGPGGQAHDVTNAIREFGMVPEEVYPGRNYGGDKHNHSELDNVLEGFLKGVLKTKKLTKVWDKAFESILDVYLGEVPSEFEYQGKTYTPKSFAEASGFKAEDYIEFTSYTNYPFYEKVILELPDNWSLDYYYNIPLEDLMSIMNNALSNGFSIQWDGDTGKDNFYRDQGYALVPKDKKIDIDEIEEPIEEKEITQEFRQESFDNFDVIDDHLMHVVGLAEDQNGTKFYYTKNSWGTKERNSDDDRKYKGYWYMSESYVKMKTIAIMVHKDAVPQNLREKLGI